MSLGPLNFYFLSSGYCGTRFYHHLLRPASNAEVWHQPGHEDIAEIVDLLEARFAQGPEGFLGTEIAEFPRLARRIDKRLTLPWIYGDTLNWMRGLGHMLHQYIGPERLRLVQLVRHPVATCRSMLADRRRPAEEQFSDLGLAQSMARRWVLQYSSIQCQFQAINNPAVCRTIRLEDVGVEQIRSLYTFLGLEGFSQPEIAALLANNSRDIRHTHRADTHLPASKEELRVVWEICGALASQYGYQEETGYYDQAPSRPPQTEPAACKSSDSESAGPRRTSVKLFDFRGLGLILRGSTGIQYVNHAAGPVCIWLRAEGSFVPLVERGDGELVQSLFDHFHKRRDKELMSAIKPADADFIDALLAQHGLEHIKVERSMMGQVWEIAAWKTWDRARLTQTPWEAWTPVRVTSSSSSRIRGVLSDCNATDAILVWENSN